MNTSHQTISCELLVVGGGPAGLVGAAEAAARGVDTIVVDERATLGGQIYRQPGPGFVVNDPRQLGREYWRGVGLIEAARRAGVGLSPRTSVLSIRDTTAVCISDGATSSHFIEARRILFAPGAHDRPVAFPGWTLPGIVTSGGAQALVKSSRVAPGDRVVFAGSGPLALAFPAQLRHYGVNVVLALEAGPPPRARAVAALLRAAKGNYDLLRDGIRYRAMLARMRVPLRHRRIVVRAEGDGRLEQVVHAAVDDDWNVIPGTEERLAADTACIGYGFMPSIELLRLAGCEFDYDEDLGGPVVRTDSWQRTSVPGVFAAGDGTGVRGAPAAEAQGRLAGLAAALDIGKVTADEAERLAAPTRRRLAQKERFRRALLTMYAMRTGIYRLAKNDTTICRCEEVSLGALEAAIAASSDLNVVKAYTRAGMGLCQGVNCQHQIAALVSNRTGAPVPSVMPATARPPVRPAPIGAIADETVKDEGLFVRD